MRPVKTDSIEPVHRGPAIEPVADIHRNALLTPEIDEARNKAVIAVAMDRWRKTVSVRANPRLTSADVSQPRWQG